MATIYVARHGESDWNREGRYQGRRESPLTDLGQQQAAALAQALTGSGAQRVICSPLGRCLETARPVAAALGVELEIDPLLLEIAHGTWEGRLRAEIAVDDAGRMSAWRNAPQTVRFEGGESLADVAERWRRFADSLDSKRSTVVVTHDVMVRLAILAATRGTLAQLWEPRVVNGGYAVFTTDTGGWHLVDGCADAHIAGIMADESRQAR